MTSVTPHEIESQYCCQGLIAGAISVYETHYSCGMNNLTPEPRVNKHGVTVIKHVRASPKENPSRAKLPAPAAKPIAKKKDRRIIRSRHSFSDWEHMSDSRFARAPGTYEIIASDEEMYSVLGIAETGNAFALMERGACSVADAKELLRKMDAEDLLIDQSDLMQELLNRNISPKDTASLLSLIPDEWSGSPHVADAIEFSAYEEFQGRWGANTVRRYILAGNINLADIKTIGVRHLGRVDNLAVVTDTLVRLGSGESKRTAAETAVFLERAIKEGVVEDSLRNGLALFEKHGTEVVDKLEHIESFSVRYHPSETEDAGEAVDRVLYEALLAEALVRLGKPESGEYAYWIKEYPDESNLLRTEGISIEDAAQGMYDGLTARQITAVSKGISVSVSDGWL